MMGIPCQAVKAFGVAWLTGWQAESGRTGRERIVPRPAMQMLLSAATILVLFAWAQEEVAKRPGVGSPFWAIKVGIVP
jgi:hypothetical protein